MRRLTLRLLNIYIIFYFFLKVGEFSSFSPPHVLFLDFTKVALHVSQFKISPDYLILSLSIISCLTLDTVAPLSLRPPALRELSPNWLPLGRGQTAGQRSLYDLIFRALCLRWPLIYTFKSMKKKETAPETV